MKIVTDRQRIAAEITEFKNIMLRTKTLQVVPELALVEIQDSRLPFTGDMTGQKMNSTVHQTLNSLSGACLTWGRVKLHTNGSSVFRYSMGYVSVAMYLGRDLPGISNGSNGGEGGGSAGSPNWRHEISVVKYRGSKRKTSTHAP